MPDDPVSAPGEAWLNEYRRERLVSLERENAMLRATREQAWRILALAIQIACPNGGHLVLLAALEHVDNEMQRMDRIVRVLQETAP